MFTYSFTSVEANYQTRYIRVEKNTQEYPRYSFSSRYAALLSDAAWPKTGRAGLIVVFGS